MPKSGCNISLLADKTIDKIFSVEDLEKFIDYLQSNAAGGVFRDAFLAGDYSLNISPDSHGELTEEERELIPLYNALTPAQRESLAADVDRHLRRSPGM